MAIDATVGGAASNSYVTLAEATAYFAGREPSVAWDDAAAADQEDGLLTATRRIEQERFHGHTVLPLTGTSSGPTQALSFPRYGVLSREGWTYLHTVIPEGIKRAQLEATYAILSGDLAVAETGLERFRSAKVGPLAVEINHARVGGALPSAVLRELREFTLASGFNVPLVRS